MVRRARMIKPPPRYSNLRIGMEYYKVPDTGPTWTPADPTPDGSHVAEHWYKSDVGLYQEPAGTTPADTDGDPVGLWEDQAASGDDVSQATAASKPTWKDAILNGLPVLRFDGTDDLLRGAFTTGGATNQPLTILIVAALDAASVDDGNGKVLIDGDDSTNRASHYKSVASPDPWTIYHGALIVGGAASSDWLIWTSRMDGANSRVWHNGISAIAGNAGAAAPDGLTIGSRQDDVNPWDGDVAEIILYDADLSDADKNTVGQYLADRFGLSYTDIT